MDVIGDEGHTPTVPVPDVPGERTYKLHSRRTLAVLVYGSFICILAVAGFWVWSHRVAALAVGAATLLGMLGTVLVSNAYYDQWRVLYETYRQVRQHAQMLSKQHAYAAGFIAIFKPFKGDVERLLQERAYAVLKAHEKEVEFRARGVGGMTERVYADPEAEAKRLTTVAEQHRAKVEGEIVSALGDFRRARDLAKAQGYGVHESWKEYIPPEVLPRQLKKGIPGPVFAEGANTRPDCGCLVDDCRHTFVAVEGANEQPGQ
jgi:hypothetical protein